jgi:DNA primase
MSHYPNQAHASSNCPETPRVALPDKPDIVEIVSRYTALRRVGREHRSLCVFHNDRHPSFSVSEDKGLFHCFACGESGDVIDFVMKHDNLTFPEALAELGISTARPRRDDPRRQAAEKVARWIREQREKLNQRIRDLDEQIFLADELDDTELAESFWRERRIVADLRDDLAHAEYLPDFVELKEAIEAIAGVA